MTFDELLDQAIAMLRKRRRVSYRALKLQLQSNDEHLEALAVMDITEVRFYGAELYRLKGTLLLHQAVPDAAQAETCFQQALDIARRQEAKSWELRAATSLAHLWQSQGKRQAAYDLLAPVYDWFTEGFDTTDLKEAKTLLEELRS